MKPILVPLAASVALLSAPAPNAGQIEWSQDYAAALERAAAESLPVFVAVNMDGERGNDRMVENVYPAKEIEGLSEHTVNLIASTFHHTGGGKTCKRFGAITCPEHIAVEREVRAKHLAPDARGNVIAPQHVFLAPDGSVILSVPYEITTEELEWCFATAIRHVDPDAKLSVSSSARAPKRLVMAGVAGTGLSAVMTREEALELIDQIKRNELKGGERNQAFNRILTVDEPEAIKFVTAELRSIKIPKGGGAGRLPNILRTMGATSPASYAELVEEYLGHQLEEVRNEAAVALEQIGHPDSVKKLKSALSKEDSRKVEKNLLRAIGTTGTDSSWARKTLLRSAEKEKDDLLRLNAIVALGTLSPHENIDEFLFALVDGAEEAEEQDRIAAVCALVLTRDARWIEKLEGVAGVTSNKGVSDACRVGATVLRSGTLEGMAAALRAVARDEIPRTRIYGGS